ncbi:MAG: amidohydrolase family protein [Emcibacter sp.]|nr:amidohydrolase family protein [Emcibacter sp.]
MVRKFLVLGGCVMSLFIVACDKEYDKKSVEADTVILKAQVYTANDHRDMATAFAIKDGTFIYVGDDTGAETFIGQETEVIRLENDLILPGLHDNHIHASGIIEFERCDLESNPMNLDELSTFMSDCMKRLKPEQGAWLVGEQWGFSTGNTPTKQFKTIREALDAVSKDIPITLAGNDGHHGAYNSAALALAKNKAGETIGLSKATLQTEFSDFAVMVGVDRDGNLDGMVNEQARNAMAKISMLDGDINKMVENAAQIPARLNSEGITSIREAAFSKAIAPLYEKLAQDQQRPLRITLSQFYNPLDYIDANNKVNWDVLSRDAYKTREHFEPYKNIKADSMKMFIDGVSEGNPLATPPSLPNAAKLTPYKQPIFEWNSKTEELQLKGYVNTESEACKFDPSLLKDQKAINQFIEKNGFLPQQCAVSTGVLESPYDVEMDFIKRFHAEGYALHLHVIGDRAVRTALDGLENARKINGPSPQPQSLAHIQFVHPDDIKRIGDLGLYLAYTYAWISPVPEYDLTVMPFIDEIKDIHDLYRKEYYSYTQAYPVRSTMQAGAILIAGSDAPVEMRDPRPFFNIEQAVTRAGASGMAYNENETVSILDAIDAYTINGAKALHQAEIVGSFEVGKKADFIILNQNIIDLASSNPTAIRDTKVISTWFDGVLVYKSE